MKVLLLSKTGISASDKMFFQMGICHISNYIIYTQNEKLILDIFIFQGTTIPQEEGIAILFVDTTNIFI